MNQDIVSLIYNNSVPILLIIISLIPIFPQKYIDPFGEEMNKRMTPPFPSKPYSLLRLLSKGVFDAFAEFAINIGLRGSVTALMFIVVAFDLINKNTLSPEGVIVIVVAVISLYLEYLVNNADEIEFFKIFKYKRRKENS